MTRMQTILLTGMLTSNAIATAQAPISVVPTGSVAFVDVNVIPMDDEHVLRNQTVVIENGRITSLGPSKNIPLPARALRIDGKDKYLIPGLADMHVHLSQGWKITFDNPLLDSLDAERLLLRYLANGVTLIRNMDHGDSGRTQRITDTQVLRLKARANAGTLLSPRIYTSGRWWPATLGRWWRLPKDQQVKPESVTTYLAAYKASGFDHVKLYDRDTSEIFDSLVTSAHRLGIPIAGHLPPGVSLDRGLKTYHSIEHLMGYGRGDRVQIDTASIRSMAVSTQRSGVWNCPTQMVIQLLSLPALGKTTAPIVKALQEAGAGLLLCTDTPMGGLQPGSSVHQELQAFVRAGLTPHQALATGTRNVATFYGTLNKSGTIAVGKRADLVLLRGNPLQNIKNTASPAGVMIGGRWLPREELDRRLLGSGPEERKQYYHEFMENAYYTLFGRFHKSIEGQQYYSIKKLMRAQQLQHEAIADSLASKSDAELTLGAARQHALSRVVQQFRELRDGLTPEQQADAFDPLARTWMQDYTELGYRVNIPGITPSVTTP